MSGGRWDISQREAPAARQEEIKALGRLPSLRRSTESPAPRRKANWVLRADRVFLDLFGLLLVEEHLLPQEFAFPLWNADLKRGVVCAVSFFFPFLFLFLFVLSQSCRKSPVPGE